MPKKSERSALLAILSSLGVLMMLTLINSMVAAVVLGLAVLAPLGALAQLMTRVELTDPAIDPAQALPGRVEAPPERP